MQAQLTLLQTGLLVVGVMVLWKVVNFTIDRYLKKTVDTEYVTILKCRQCREDCQERLRDKDAGADGKHAATNEKLEKIGNTLDSFREVLFEIAMNGGVDPEKIKPLLNRG